MNISETRKQIRPIALSIAAPALGFAICLLLKMSLHVELTKLPMSIINFIVAGFFAFILFPRILGIPFGKIQTREFIRKIGLGVPDKLIGHIALGIILALCTLSGMLIASILTGKYSFDISTINLDHMVFSLNPGIWEEVFYRGVIMITLIGMTKSVKKAFVYQILIFGVLHIKGFDLLSLVDAFSVLVIAIGFTYAAYKTGSLIPGIIFHFLHDVFLFTVQLPDGVYTGFIDNVLFYSILWIMVGVGCIVTKIFADKFRVRNATVLYDINASND